jgi:Sec-independent protein translocase protein TatA
LVDYDGDKAQKKLEELERDFGGVVGEMKRTVEYFGKMLGKEAMGKEEESGEEKNRDDQGSDDRWRQEYEEEVVSFDNLEIRGSDGPWAREQADI